MGGGVWLNSASELNDFKFIVSTPETKESLFMGKNRSLEESRKILRTNDYDWLID